jgi:hypothetical protein
MNSILASASQPARFQTLLPANPLLIADKTLAYDATALLTAAFKGAPFNYPAATAGLGSLYGRRVMLVMQQQREIMLLTAS